jgi:hypothetical protein
VGFGDVPLKRYQSQQLLGCYIIFSTVLMTFAFNNFKNLQADIQRVKEAAEFAKRKKTLAKIKELDTGNGVPMDAFLLAVLEQLGVLDRERDIEPWIKVSAGTDFHLTVSASIHLVLLFFHAEIQGDRCR